MNKKVLFGIMSLAALAACTTDDFESQKVAQETGSSVQFKVLNNAQTRASMDGNTISWSAKDGDLFTLYHGGTVSSNALAGYQNATYTASDSEGQAILTTPTMIKNGKAVMVWPVDTAFVNDGSAALAISIPEVLDNIENNIPYASDLVAIAAYDGTKGADNSAGYSRKYPVYMRPMASQLTLKADYAGTESTLSSLYEGADAIDPIAVTSVELSSSTDNFTKTIPLKFDGSTTGANWVDADGNHVEGNAWDNVTDFDKANATKVAKLTTKVVNGNESSKFLILPGEDLSTVANAAVVVNTTYGKVLVAGPTVEGSKYTAAEIADAWYRIASATATLGTGETQAAEPESDGKYKYTANVEKGMIQTINGFSGYKTTSKTSYVYNEPTGASATRYVKVLLTKLDMDGLHITSDKQLRDAAKVWQALGVNSGVSVQVNLDGNDDGEFAISQETIAAINEINAAAAEEETTRKFTVMPCADHVCTTIVITGGGDVPSNLDFIVKNAGTPGTADVALNAGQAWSWKGNITVDATSTGIAKIVNRGTLNNAETTTLAIYNNAATPVQVTDIPFDNVKGANWNIKAGAVVNVQFDVTNLGTVTIEAGAQYRQDGSGNVFTNQAKTLPQRFLADDKVEEIGVVDNSGVFASVNSGNINNYGLIEHRTATTKTYVTTNATTGMTFATAFVHDETTPSNDMKIGRINLPFSIKSSVDNASITNSLNAGFVSLTVTADNNVGTLKASEIGKANYVIVEGGVTAIDAVANDTYIEINQPGTELAWTAGKTFDNLAGLIIFSDINVKQGTKVAVKTGGATYLAADVYVGGVFTPTNYVGYYGDTSAKEATNIITY